MTERAVAAGTVDLPAGEIREYFSSRAELVDRGDADIRDGLRYLAGLGLLGHEDLGVQCQTVALVARSCMASAFSLWAHRMVVEYFSASSSAWLRAKATDLRHGDLLGSTAMAPAMQNLVGLAELGTRFVRDGDTLVIDGDIRWASNLFGDGFVAVLGARGEDGSRVVVAVPSDAAGLRAGAPLDLLALGATVSSTLTFEGVRVGPERVVSAEFGPFLRQIKPPFLLLQSAFCLGLARESLAVAAARLERTLHVFRADHQALDARMDRLETRHRALIDARGPASDLVALRLDAAVLAQEAVALEARVTGGAGYLAASPTARRLREAAFLPVQSPTEGHLRWELASAG